MGLLKICLNAGLSGEPLNFDVQVFEGRGGAVRIKEGKDLDITFCSFRIKVI